jgi:hypothetical protein
MILVRQVSIYWRDYGANRDSLSCLFARPLGGREVRTADPYFGIRSTGRSVGRHVGPGLRTISGTLNSQLHEPALSSLARGGIGSVPISFYQVLAFFYAIGLCGGLSSN